MRTRSALASGTKRMLGVLCLGACSLGAAGTGAAYYVSGTMPVGATLEHPGRDAAAPGRTGQTPPIRLAQTQLAEADDPWMESVRSGKFWSGRSSGTSAQRRSSRSSESRKASRSRASAQRERRQGSVSRYESTWRPERATTMRSVSVPSEWRNEEWKTWEWKPSGRSGTTYRTMCVRLCDGFYWPVSFATTGGNIERDVKTCNESCNAPSALYYYPNPGGEPEEMISVQGEPYTQLGTAFRFRTKYDANCKCRAHPWEQEALEQHQRYAEEAQKSPVATRSKR